MNNIRDTKSVKDSKDLIREFDVRTNPFMQNISGEHAYKRTERIVSALYLVTNHVPYDEPLRTKSRSIGHELLSQVLALRGGFRSVGHEHMSSLIARIRELVSCVQLLCVSGYLSRQNADILNHAIDELGQFLVASQRSILSEDLVLQREDFVPHARNTQREEAEASAPSSSRSMDTDGGEPTVREHSKKNSRSQVRSARQRAVHDERQKLILDIISTRGPLGIKDITANVVGCSEKTVQREINTLVKGGYVKKQGEKRWSKYTAVQ